MKLISQLSKQTGVPIGTIRFYEKSGLISGFTNPEITTNKYVYYSEETVEKLQFIKDSKSVGFTLAEIREVIDAWFGNTLTKNEKTIILQKKIEEIEQKISELTWVKSQIESCLIDVQNE